MNRVSQLNSIIKFGLKYNKIKDGERIAQKMKENEIPVEIKQIIQQLSSS